MLTEKKIRWCRFLAWKFFRWIERNWNGKKGFWEYDFFSFFDYDGSTARVCVCGNNTNQIDYYFVHGFFLFLLSNETVKEREKKCWCDGGGSSLSSVVQLGSPYSIDVTDQLYTFNVIYIGEFILKDTEEKERAEETEICAFLYSFDQTK